MLERLEPTKNNILHIANNIRSSYFRSKFLKFACACQMINLKSDKFKVSSVRIQYTNRISQEIGFAITCISHFYTGWRIENYSDFLSVEENKKNLIAFVNKNYLDYLAISGWYVGVKFNFFEKTVEITDFFRKNFPKEFRTIIENYMLYTI